MLEASVAFLAAQPRAGGGVGAVWWAKSTANKRRAAGRRAPRTLAGGGSALSRRPRTGRRGHRAHATALAGEERTGARAICLGGRDLDDAEAPLAAARVACGPRVPRGLPPTVARALRARAAGRHPSYVSAWESCPAVTPVPVNSDPMNRIVLSPAFLFATCL